MCLAQPIDNQKLISDAIAVLDPLLQDYRAVGLQLRIFIIDYLESTVKQRQEQMYQFRQQFLDLQKIVEFEINYCIGRKHSLKIREDPFLTTILIHMYSMRAALALLRMIAITEGWYIQNYDIQTRYERVLHHCLRIRTLLGISSV